MHVRRILPRRLFGEAAAVEAPAAASAPVAAPAPTAGAPAAAPAASDGASGGGAAGAGSLMARGSAAPAAGPAPTAAPAPASDAAPAVPEKYQVKNEDGSINWEASALKQAQGYQHLAQRLGSDSPPKTPDEYAPDMPQGVTMEQLKTDPLFAGFLKSAHAHGMTNKQVSFALTQFQERMQLLDQQRNSPEVAEAELLKVWTAPGAMEKGLSNSYRAAHAFSDDKEHAARLEEKFGNDPDFIRLMARVGSELREDRPPEGLTGAEQESRETLMRHPAYSDPKHPEHGVTVAKVRALYAKQFPEG